MISLIVKSDFTDLLVIGSLVIRSLVISTTLYYSPFAFYLSLLTTHNSLLTPAHTWAL